MKASEYLDKYVAPSARPFATLVVSAGLKFTHMTLAPDQLVPEEDQRNITLFIAIDRDSMPPELIADHNCKDGWICEDHPDQPEGHDGCYSASNPCPYPTCEVSGKPPVEDTPDADSQPEQEADYGGS